MVMGAYLFSEFKIPIERSALGRLYRPFLTATENRKGVLDVDTVKGCQMGMHAYPRGGCYGDMDDVIRAKDIANKLKARCGDE
jgi:hypothetical protein